MNNGQRFHKHLVALKRAYRSLAEFGPTKQRRQRALAALRALRADVDEYKVTIKRKKARRLKSFEARARKLIASGWTAVLGSDVIARYAAAGVPVRRIRAKTQWALTRGANLKQEAFYVPAWAHAIGPNDPAALRKAKGNVGEQRYRMAISRLASKTRTGRLANLARLWDAGTGVKPRWFVRPT